MTAAVAAGVVNVADSVVAFTVAAVAVAAAAALPGSVRANIAVQRYILGAACEFGISVGRRQKTHDFFFSSSLKNCDLCDPTRNNSIHWIDDVQSKDSELNPLASHFSRHDK